MSGNVLGAVAIAIALLAVALGGFAYITEKEGPIGPPGPQGPAGSQGLPGTNTSDGGFAYEWNDTSIRFKNPDGTWGAWVDLEGPKGSGGGSQGPAGPRGAPGADGSDGADGIDGEDGEDCEPNLLPIVTDVTPEGCIGLYDDWIFSITVDDPEDDLMKVEFYVYVNTSWFDCSFIPWLIGDHIWVPILSEVGYDGTYTFNGTNLKDFINWEIVPIPDCIDLKWRYDITDRVVSDEPDYSPSCYLDEIAIKVWDESSFNSSFNLYFDGDLVYEYIDDPCCGDEWTYHLINISYLACCENHTIMVEYTGGEELDICGCGTLPVAWIKAYSECEDMWQADFGDTIDGVIDGWGDLCDDLPTWDYRTVWHCAEDEPTATWTFVTGCGCEIY